MEAAVNNWNRATSGKAQNLMDLGKLHVMTPRDVFPAEPAHFSTWVAENLGREWDFARGLGGAGPTKEAFSPFFSTRVNGVSAALLVLWYVAPRRITPLGAHRRRVF